MCYLLALTDNIYEDSTTGVDTPDEVLFDKATHDRRDILIPLDRFYRQLEGHEGFLSYVSRGTKPEWGPSLVLAELGTQIRSIQILRIRADQLRSRANGILELVSTLSNLLKCFGHKSVAILTALNVK